MSLLSLCLLIILATLLLLVIRVPVAFALSGVAALVLLTHGAADGLNAVAESFFGSLERFVLVAIPMFVLMGSAAAASRVGGDIGETFKRWLHPFPGGLILANIFSSALFAGIAGSSPATCAGIGRQGLPEMLKRGYPVDLSTGALAAAGTLAILIPPSLTLLLFNVAADVETDVGRLFLAGLVPGVLLAGLFALISLFILRRREAQFHDGAEHFDMEARVSILLRSLPIVGVVVAVVAVLINGTVEPSEAAGIGALLVLVLVAAVYGVRRPGRLWDIVLRSTRESVMILMIVAGAALFSAMLNELGAPEAFFGWVADLGLGPWVLILAVNVLLLVLGMVLPPVAVVLITVPLLLPVVMDAGFGPIWFAVMMTVNMQIGLITPPVGLNLQVVHALAPDVPRSQVLKGALPFLLCMGFSIALLCAFPQIATALPDALMGPAD